MKHCIEIPIICGGDAGWRSSGVKLKQVFGEWDTMFAKGQAMTRVT